MNLKDTLEVVRQRLKQQLSSDSLRLMHNYTRVLQRSCVADRSIQVGDSMHDFNLQDSEGRFVSMHKKLQDGPLVVSFIRGFW